MTGSGYRVACRRTYTELFDSLRSSRILFVPLAWHQQHLKWWLLHRPGSPRAPGYDWWTYSLKNEWLFVVLSHKDLGVICYRSVTDLILTDTIIPYFFHTFIELLMGTSANAIGMAQELKKCGRTLKVCDNFLQVSLFIKTQRFCCLVGGH